MALARILPGPRAEIGSWCDALPRLGKEVRTMSNEKKFSTVGARNLMMHMTATPAKPIDPARPTPAKAAVASSFGPATYYRLGVRMPGGPVKRYGRD
jgi:hypothetical protein